MKLRKRFRSLPPVKSPFEVVGGRAIKRANDPELIKQIEQITRKFLILYESGRIPDLRAALQQFESQIESVCVRRPAFPKSSDGGKSPPSKSIKTSNHTGTARTPKKWRGKPLTKKRTVRK